MPELPEVETMRQALLPHCRKSIVEVKLGTKGLRKPFIPNTDALLRRTSIVDIDRTGKYLFFKLANQHCLLMHAGMSGIFKVATTSSYAEHKHDHLVLRLEDQVIISFNDPRRFGLALLFPSEELALKHVKLGIDALSPQLDATKLSDAFKKRSSHIKPLLLNQQLIAGIGNIYASEILFLSNISPYSLANKIPLSVIKLILQTTKLVLERAISMGGSTLKDYRAPSGQTGYFQNTFVAYNKDNETCSQCGGKIEKTMQGGRSTFYCAQHQVLYC